MEMPTPGERAVGVVPGEIVVPSAGADRADLRMVGHHGLVHRAGVVVEPARDREIDLKIFRRNAERADVLHDGGKLVQTEIERLVLSLVPAQEGELIRARTGHGDELEDFIRGLRLDGELVP